MKTSGDQTCACKGTCRRLQRPIWHHDRRSLCHHDMRETTADPCGNHQLAAQLHAAAHDDIVSIARTRGLIGRTTYCLDHVTTHTDTATQWHTDIYRQTDRQTNKHRKPETNT